MSLSTSARSSASEVVGRKPVLPGIHPDFDRLLRLVGDIDFARRVFADQHDGEAGRQAMLRLKLLHRLGDADAQALGIGLAVDDLRHHVFSPSSRCNVPAMTFQFARHRLRSARFCRGWSIADDERDRRFAQAQRLRQRLR